MRNSLILSTFFVLILTNSFAQVGLTPLTFENGFKYPHANFPKDKTIEDKINEGIHETIKDLEANEFCIGEYGYVQKGSHIEIHIFATCMELPESEHRYVLFNIESGERVKHEDLFADKQQSDALAFIEKKLTAHQSSNALCDEKLKNIDGSAGFEDMNIRLYKDGIEIRPLKTSDCEQFPLRITWNELKEFLKYNFI